MKILSEKTKQNGDRNVLVQLRPGEHLAVINENSMYQLGYPIEDVVHAGVLLEAQRVVWCSVSQKWQVNE